MVRFHYSPPIMKTPKIPEGYESMDMEWKVDPHQSAIHLASQCPVGWKFFELRRKNTLAIITYIRPKDNAQLR